MRPRHVSLGLVLLPALLSAGLLARAAELNLFDWMGIAPIVVHGEVQNEVGKYAELRIREVARGNLQPGSLILINVRKANRHRLQSDESVKLQQGASYLMLLEPAPISQKGDDYARYFLVRGVRGVREVPAEGAAPLLQATRKLASMQDLKDERITWQAMSEFLEDTNPVLIRTSLDHHLKFMRGNVSLMPVLQPLLAHPRADLRERAALLVAQILARNPQADVPEEAMLYAELVARARRDAVIGVRVAATEALSRMWSEGTDDILREIAEKDPEQLVRYAAQKLLYERRVEQAHKAPGADR